MGPDVVKPGRWIARTAVVAGALAITAATAAPAHAATAYRYWSYYIAENGSWQYSQRGPALEHPADGEVQAWRFTVQVKGTPSELPRATPDFAGLCAKTPAADGQIRVGIVVDFGLPQDAPPGEQPPSDVFAGCVRVPTGSTGFAVLTAAVGAHNVRIGTGSTAGLVCGISGYPKTECAAVAQAQPPAPTPAQTPAPSAAGPKPAATAAAPPEARQPSTPPTTPTPSPTPTPTSAAGAASARASSALSPATSRGSTSDAGAPTASSSTAVVTADVSALRSAPKHGGGFPTGVVVGVGLVVALGAGAAIRVLAGRR